MYSPKMKNNSSLGAKHPRESYFDQKLKPGSTNIYIHRPPTFASAPAYERFEPPSSYHPAEGLYTTFGDAAKAYPTLHKTPSASIVVAQPSAGGGEVIPVTQFFGDTPVKVVCPYCHARVTTVTNPVAGCVTWLACSLLTLFGFVFGCCLLPFFVDSLKDVLHTCPNCQYPIGSFNRLTGGPETMNV